MKITIESPPPGGEEEIIIRSDRIDDRIMSLIQALKSDGSKAGGVQSPRTDTYAES